MVGILAINCETSKQNELMLGNWVTKQYFELHQNTIQRARHGFYCKMLKNIFLEILAKNAVNKEIPPGLFFKGCLILARVPVKKLSGFIKAWSKTKREQ